MTSCARIGLAWVGIFLGYHKSVKSVAFSHQPYRSALGKIFKRCKKKYHLFQKQKEKSGMKRKLFVAFALCSLLLLMYAETVTASNPAYPTTIYSGSASTIDGYWTTRTEWSDAAAPSGLPANLVFRNKYTVVFSGGLRVYEWYLVEFFGDNTNDPGDYVQICFDSNATGSTAPKTTDIRIDYVGHSGTVNTYIGTGTGWTPAALNDTTVAQTLNVSRLNSNSHWITEFRIEKTTNGLQLNNAIRVAVYDASNPSAGVIAYPPTSQQDVPNSYSLNTAAFSPFLPALRVSAFTNVAVLPGWTWYFFVHSLGGVGAHTYQWYDVSGLLAGQTSMVLPVTKNAPGAYSFFCRVTDSEGQVINSNNVTLTVR